MRKQGIRFGLAAILLQIAGVVTGVPPVSAGAAGCSYPILSLSEVTQRSPTAVVASVVREQPDGSGGFTSTLRISGLIKGGAVPPVITVNGLGRLAEDCQGGPRLHRGSRYVLFLAREGAEPNLIWSIVDAEGGVYQIAADGVRFPPDHPGGAVMPVALAAADLVRNVGIIAGADPARIEDLVTTSALPETLDAPLSAPTAQHAWYARLAALPRRETSLAVAAAAVLIASLTFLLWHPSGRDLYRRP